VEEAVSAAIRLSGLAFKPVILADIQDNAGGGSSSDTMFVLKELIKQNAAGTAVGMIFDPEAAAAAHSTGQGSVIELALGGKYISGDSPLQAAFRVEQLHDGVVTGTGPMAYGMQFDIGKMALLRLADIQIVVGSQRMQAADQALFTTLGVNPSEMKIVLVKSANHFRADFEPISSHVINVLAPGSDVEDPSTFIYRHLRSGVRLKGCGPLHTLDEYHR
jgi:microcystin degradation protein MlrC